MTTERSHGEDIEDAASKKNRPPPSTTTIATTANNRKNKVSIPKLFFGIACAFSFFSGLFQHNEIVKQEAQVALVPDNPTNHFDPDSTREEPNGGPEAAYATKQVAQDDHSVASGLDCSKSDLSEPQPNQRIGIISSTELSLESSISSNGVLEWDAAAMQYARLSYEGQATLTWLDGGGKVGNAAQASEIVRATPMLATVDRRPRQQNSRKACSATTWVALGHTREIQFDRLKPPSDELYEPTCAVCYQWANHIVAQQQIIYLVRTMNRNSTVYRPYDLGLEDTTVCVTGKATFSKRQRWRSAYWHMFLNERYNKGKKEDDRDTAHGFIWSTWCDLPEARNPDSATRSNLTTSCERLHPASWSDELQRVYLTTSFTLKTKKKIGGGSRIRIDATWPWRALVLNEHLYDPPVRLPRPKHATDMQILWAEGPLWQREDFGPEKNRLQWNMSFAATLKRTAPSGVGERFLLSILQQATVAPNSTRLLGVVDSHTRPTYNALSRMLQRRVQDFLPFCDHDDTSFDHEPMTLVYKKRCLTTDSEVSGDLTLVRQMGQHAFSAWLGLRFSPEYHAILYFDSDAIPFVNPQTHATNVPGKLQDNIFQRFYGSKNSCANYQFQALEYTVKHKGVVMSELSCTNQLLTNPQEMNRTLQFCVQREGHVLARTDSLGMLWIHDNYAEKELGDLAPWARFCNETERIFPSDKVVEVHLRSRGRIGQGHRCTCILNRKKE